MKTEQQYFNEGLPIKDYMEQMTKFKEESFNVYRLFELPHDENFLSLLNREKTTYISYYRRLVWRCNDEQCDIA